MLTVKKDRLEELTKLGFENRVTVYTKKMRESEINVNVITGTFYVYMSSFVFEDFISEMTRISNALLADRHDVNIMIDILREKGLIKSE